MLTSSNLSAFPTILSNQADLIVVYSVQCIAFHVREPYVTEHRYKDRIIDLLPSQQQNGQWDCPFIVKTFKNHRMDVYKEASVNFFSTSQEAQSDALCRAKARIDRETRSFLGLNS